MTPFGKSSSRFNAVADCAAGSFVLLQVSNWRPQKVVWSGKRIPAFDDRGMPFVIFASILD